jgi:hypothetical protein
MSCSSLNEPTRGNGNEELPLLGPAAPRSVRSITGHLSRDMKQANASLPGALILSRSAGLRRDRVYT